MKQLFRPLQSSPVRPLIAAVASVVAASFGHGPVSAAPTDSSGRTGIVVDRRGQFEQALTDGFRSLQKGDLKAAETAFDGVLKADPQNTGAMLGLAEAKLKRGDKSGAEALIQRALSIRPDDPDVLIAQGRFLAAQSRFKEAQVVYAKAADRAPQSFAAQKDLGDLYLTGLRKPAEAIASYRRAIALQPDSAVAHFGLGMALLAAGDSGAALKELAETARLDPKDPAADHVAGRIHASAKRFDAAIASFDKALGISPDFLPALSDRADLHAELGHDALAAADYERLLVLSPSNATASLKLGMVYQRLNRMDDASKAYRSALAMNADLPVALNNLAMIALRRNEDPAQAVAWAKRAVALAPKVPQFQDTLGWSYRAQGDRTRAIAALETASQLPPPQADILFRLGTVYEESDRRADAKAAYTRALSLNPDFPDAALARARLSALSK